MWIYAVTAEAVKLVFIVLGILMILALLYVIYKLLAYCLSREFRRKADHHFVLASSEKPALLNEFVQKYQEQQSRV